MRFNKSKIARESGLSRQTVIKIFNGKTKNVYHDSLKKIAETLNLSIDELLKKIADEVCDTTAILKNDK